MKFIRSLTRREEAATAIEYALIAAGIAVVIIVAVNALGGSLAATFSSITTSLGL